MGTCARAAALNHLGCPRNFSFLLLKCQFLKIPLSLAKNQLKLTLFTFVLVIYSSFFCFHWFDSTFYSFFHIYRINISNIFDTQNRFF